MRITILTLFPEFFETPLATSMVHRAQHKKRVEFEVVNIRDFATDKHRTTDDRPYGGGPGMVMKVEPIDLALQYVKKTKTKNQDKQSLSVLTSAKGRLFTQQTAARYSQLDHLIIVCGHYQGVDERVSQHLVDEEVRIGDFVMTGGETAALTIADCVTRLQSGVLGNEASLEAESHSIPGRLSYPHYTRPEEYKGWSVPQELLKGHHAAIEQWRKKHATTELDQ